jgi:hypothetical protein
MDKTALLLTEQIGTLEQLIDNEIAQISSLQFELADTEHDQRDYIVSGNSTAPILEMEEARLLALVNSDPANSNEARRKAAMTQLKSQDAQYLQYAQDVANLKRYLEQRRIEAMSHGFRLQAAMESQRCKRAMLGVLAGNE